MIVSTKILILACSLAVALALPVSDDEHPTLEVKGGVKELKGEDLESAVNDLKASLAKFAAGDGPHYEVDQVNSATTQVVSGSLRKFNVDLINRNKEKKNCNVSIWSQPWLPDGIEVTFECEGVEKVVKKHSA